MDHKLVHIAISAELPIDHLFDPVGDVYYARHGRSDCLGDILGMDDSFTGIDCSTESSCEILNRAITDSDARYVVLIMQEFTTLSLVDGEELSLGGIEFNDFIAEITTLMGAMRCGCGGVSHLGVSKPWDLRPVTTTNAPSMSLLVIDKEMFMGFRDVPYPYGLHDYVLRSIIEDGGCVRLNTYSSDNIPVTSDVSDGSPYQEFLGLWGKYVKYRPNANGDFLNYKLPVEGVN